MLSVSMEGMEISSTERYGCCTPSVRVAVLTLMVIAVSQNDLSAGCPSVKLKAPVVPLVEPPTLVMELCAKSVVFANSRYVAKSMELMEERMIFDIGCDICYS